MTNEPRASQTPRQALAAALRRILARGITAGRDLTEFLESSFGPLAPDSLTGLLSRDDAEALVAREALLTPTPEARLELEPYLTRAALRLEDIPVLADAVAPGPFTVPVAWGSGPEALRGVMALTAEDAAGYIARLRPEHTPPVPLMAVCRDRLPPEYGMAAQVRLRLARLAWTPERVAALADLLPHLPADADFLPCLDWLCLVLCEVDASVPLAAALRARHDAARRNLARALWLEELRSGKSFEQLFAQGVREPHLHADDFRLELSRVDRTCLAAFGVGAEALFGGPGEEDLGDFGGVGEAERLIRALASRGA